MRDGPAVGLALVESLMADGSLDGYSLAHSSRAELCRRLGRLEEAHGWYERAFAGYRALGETRLPALIAGRELSFLHAAVFGNSAAAGTLSVVTR